MEPCPLPIRLMNVKERMSTSRLDATRSVHMSVIRHCRADSSDRRQPWTVESSRAAAGVMQYLSTGIGSRALERGGGPVCDSPALILSSRLSGHLLCYCCTSPSPPCTYRPTVGLGQPSEPSSRTTTFNTLVHSKVFLLFPHIMRRMVYCTLRIAVLFFYPPGCAHA